MDEEKTIDEAVEEPADEMKEIEPVTFDDIIKDEPVKETAPVLRALGDPDPADMNMIHKHLDNFLAMLCGETPIDDNVRTSTEYWLKRLADGLGGSTKKIYFHPVVFGYLPANTKIGDYYYNGRFACTILNNDPTPFTYDTFKTWLNNLYTEIGDTVRIICTTTLIETVSKDPIYLSYLRVNAVNSFGASITDKTGFISDATWDFANPNFFIDGVNAIN